LMAVPIQAPLATATASASDTAVSTATVAASDTPYLDQYNCAIGHPASTHGERAYHPTRNYPDARNCRHLCRFYCPPN
jgi:hypothetical protein